MFKLNMALTHCLGSARVTPTENIFSLKTVFSGYLISAFDHEQFYKINVF